MPFVKVSEKESLAEFNYLKIYLENGHMLKCEILEKYFPGAVGLWYRNGEGDKEEIPTGEDGYFRFKIFTQNYYCTYLEGTVALDSPNSDLIILGIPEKMSHKDMLIYLERYIEVEALGKIEGFGARKFAVVRCKDIKSFWSLAFRRLFYNLRWFYIRPLISLDVRGLGIGDTLLVVPKLDKPEKPVSCSEDEVKKYIDYQNSDLNKMIADDICSMLKIGTYSHEKNDPPAELEMTEEKGLEFMSKAWSQAVLKDLFHETDEKKVREEILKKATDISDETKIKSSKSTLYKYFSSKGTILGFYYDKRKRFALIMFENALITQRLGHHIAKVSNQKLIMQPIVFEPKTRRKFLSKFIENL